MRIDLTFPVLPPSLDGIGDHTAHLARALADEGCTVRVLTTQEEWTPLRGVKVQRAFHLQRRRGILELIDVYRSRPHPDWLLLQFEQFSYGRWGLNPFLPLALRQIKRIAPATKIAVMFHEDYMPAHGIKSAIMSSWQRLQFRSIGRIADLALLSTAPWVDAYADWFPNTRTAHLPVGSNLPHIDTEASAVRAELGLSPETLVLGFFGSAHPSRLLEHVAAAADACRAHHPTVAVLYIGPHGNRVKGTLGPEANVLDLGPLPADAVSVYFAAMDLYLAPYERGVSTRRGAFLAGLQHGLPTVSTSGSETGAILLQHEGIAFTLSPWSRSDVFANIVITLSNDLSKRRTMGQAGQKLYATTFDWPNIARRLLTHLTPQSETAVV
jgi:glycosyltransferase involved in cell wall biosynthesis